MRFSIERPNADLQAAVIINRAGGRIETLQLLPVAGNDGVYLSAAAPDEPHEFSANLTLKSGGKEDVLAFKMVEPEGHKH